MTSSSSGREPLEKLAEEFAERFRRGERPALTEYVEKHPELADEIRELFPALVEMEELRPAGNQATGPYDRAAGVSQAVPERMGDYRILREVSRGGMGIVYEAVQESLGRHVALKVLPFHSLSSTHHLERFRREARAAARLHHTNIVPVFGVGEHEGVHYYAMQFIQGQSLDSVLYELKRLPREKGEQRGDKAGTITPRAANGEQTLSASIAQGLLTGEFRAETLGPPKSGSDRSPLSIHHSPSSELTTQSETQYFRSVAQVGVQVAEALAYAHQHGILHRDIKPSNLLLDTQGTVWVTDFGLVKEEGSGELTSPGDIVGTLRYMAPERFQGQADPRSDVYGLGLTLYEMLTLEPAFDDTDRARLMDRVRQEEPPRPRKLEPRIPRDLETIVLKAIAKEPAVRYATATALAEDLRRFLADRPIHARRASVPERLWRWRRRNPLVASLTAAVVVVLLAGICVSSFFAFEEIERANEAEHNARQARANETKAKSQEKLANENATKAETQRQRAEGARQKEETARQDADAQRMRADNNYAKARAAVHESFTKISESQLLNVPGMQPLRRELLTSALKFYQDFLTKHGKDPAVQAELAATFFRVGKIYNELGQSAESNRAYREAQLLYEALVKAEPKNIDFQDSLAECFYRTNREEKAIEIWETLVQAQPDNLRFQRNLGNAYNDAAADRNDRKKPAEVLELHQKALPIRERLVQLNPEDPELHAELGATLNNLGVMLSRQNHLQDALVMYRRGAQHKELAMAKIPNNILYGRWVALGNSNLAYIERQLGLTTDALNSYRKSLKVWQKLASDNPAVPHLQAGLVEAYQRLAGYQRELGQAKAAAQSIRLAREVIERLPRGTARELYDLACIRASCAASISEGKTELTPEEQAERQRELNLAMDALSQAVAKGFKTFSWLNTQDDLAPLRERADFKELVASLEEATKADTLAKGASGKPAAERLKAEQQALSPRRKLAAAEPKNPQRQADLAASLHNIGNIQIELGRLEEAAKALAEALPIRENLLRGDPKSPAHRTDVGLTYVAIGQVDWKTGRLAEGERNWRRGLALLEEAARDDPQEWVLGRAAYAHNHVGFAYTGGGLREEAPRHYLKSMEWSPGSQVDSYYHSALLSLLAGDEERYRQLCRDTLERFSQASSPFTAFRAAQTCILGPDPVAGDRNLLVELSVKNLATEPKAAWRIFFLGLAHYRAGELDQALQRYQESFAIDAGWPVGWPGMAILQHRLGHAEEAKRWLTKAHEWREKTIREMLAGNTYQVPINLHSWLEFHALYREAGILIEGKPPDETWLRLLSGRAYAKLGNTEKAEAEFQAAAAVKLNDPQLLLARARVFTQLGQHLHAEATFAEAIKLKPDDPMLWLARGRYFAERGDHKKADADFAKAASFTPDELNRFFEAGWWVIGPYAEDLKTTRAPELNPDPSRSVAAVPMEMKSASDELAWRLAPTGDYGRVELAPLFNNREHISAYALTYVHSPDERTATLLVGGDRMRVWLNGRLVHETAGDLNGDWGADIDRVPIILQPGRNTILLKVSTPNQPYWFRVRLTDNPLDRGVTLAQLGLWDEACAWFAKAFAVREAEDVALCRIHAELLLASGDLDHYRRHCARMLEKFGNTSNYGVTYEVAMACGLAPEGISDTARLVELAKKGQVPGNAAERWRLDALARAHYRAGQFEEAIKVLSESPEAWQGRGLAILAMAHHRLGHKDEARQWLTKLESFYNQMTQDALREAHFRHWHGPYWWGRAWDQIGYREAKMLIEGAAFKGDPNLLRLQARAYVDLKQWDKAAKRLKQAIDLAGPDDDLWYQFVLTHLAAGGQNGYRAACARLLELFGKHPDGRTADLLAWCCGMAPGGVPDPQGVVRLAEQAVAALPRHQYHLYNFGTALYRAGRYQEAVQQLNEAMKLRGGGGCVWDWLFLSMSHHHLGNAKEARRWLSQACQWIDQAEKLTWNQRLDLQFLRGEAEALLGVQGPQIAGSPPVDSKLISDYDLAILLQPDQARHWLARGRRYAELKQWTKAEADLAKAVELKKDDPEAWKERARIHAEHGEPDKAAAHFVKSLELAPQQATYDELLQWEQLFDLVAKQRPKDMQLRIARGRGYALSGQWAKAAAEYAKAIPMLPPDAYDARLHFAALLLLAGDTNSYQQLCDSAVKTLGETKDPRFAHGLAVVCGWAAKPPVDPARMVQWGERGVADPKPWHFYSSGLAHYRAGQFDRAIQRLQEANAGQWYSKAQCWPVLAMAHYRQGNANEAAQWLQKTVAWMDSRQLNTPAGVRAQFTFLEDWLALCLLRREAEALVKITAAVKPQTGPEILAVAPRPVADDARKMQARVDQASNLHAIGVIQGDVNRPAQATQLLKQASALREALVRDYPQKTQFQADLAATQIALGNLDWQAQRFGRAARGWQKGLDLLDQAVAAVPNNRQLLAQAAVTERAIGQRYAEIGLWEEAIKHTARAFDRLPPGNGLEWTHPATLYLLVGDVEGYRRQCLRTLKQFANSADPPLLTDISRHCCLVPDPVTDAATLLKLAEKALQVQPKLGFRHLDLALAQYRAGQYSEVIRRLTEYPDGTIGLALLALTHQRLGQVDKAREWLQKADRKWTSDFENVLSSPSMKVAADWVGAVWWGNFQIIRREAHELIDGKPPADDPWLLLHRGNVYARLGQVGKADAAFNAAVNLQPKDPDIWMARGKVFAQLGRHDRAEADFAKVLELKPNDPKLWIERGRYFAERGQDQKADAHFAQAAKLTPGELNRFLEAGWWVVGAYPRDLNLVCPPEFNPDPAKPVAAFSMFPAVPAGSPLAGLSTLGCLAVPQLNWVACQPQGHGLMIQRGIPALDKNFENVSIYAVTYVYSPDERQVTLHLGADDHMRLWLNGKLVHETTKILGNEWDLDRVPVTLKPGRNTLLVKVNNYESAYYFRVRIGDNPLDRGYTLAELGLWDEAAAAFEKGIARDEPNAGLQRLQAQFLAYSGDLDGYRRVCGRMVKQFGETTNPAVAWELEAACSLSASGIPDPKRLVQLADVWLKAGFKEPWRMFHVALAHYRAGKFAEAVRFLEVPEVSGNPWAPAVLAMAHHRLGRADQAKHWLAKIDVWYNQQINDTLAATSLKIYQDWVWGPILWREARELIEGKPPPADPRLRLLRARGFVQLGQSKQAEAEFQAAITIKPDDPALLIARGRFYAERGEHKKADADFAKAAALTPNELNKFIEAGWWVAGPYPGDLKTACPPERNADPSKLMAGGAMPGDQTAKLPWRWAGLTHPEIGLLEVGPLFNNAPNISAYALTYVHSPDERSALLWVGGSTNVRLWLNGRLVYEAAPARSWEWSLDPVPVMLRAGRNTLLAKVGNGAGSLHRLILRVADGPFDRGIAYAQLGLWQEAAALFIKGLKDRPQLTNPWVYLILRRFHAQLLLASGDVDGYRQQCAAILERWGQESHADLLFNVAYGLSMAPEGIADAGRLPQMAQKGQRPELASENWRRLTLGIAHYRAGQFQQAIEILNEFAGDSRALPVLAMAHHRLGHADETKSWLAKSIWPMEAAREQFPGENWAHWAESVVLCREATALIAGNAPKEDTRIQAMQARAREILKKRDQATADFDQAILLQPDRPRLWLARGRRHAELKRWKEADADLAKAAELSPKDSNVWCERGRIHAEHGLFDKAAADFAKCLEISPQQSSYVELVPWEQVFEKVAKLRPKDRQLWVARAHFHGRRGEWQKAQTAVTKAIDLDPTEHVAWYDASVLHLQLGDVDGYRRICREMLMRFGQTKDPYVANRTAEACLLVPGAVENRSSVRKLAELAAAADPKDPALKWFQVAVAMADYRDGKFAVAVERFRKTLSPAGSEDAYLDSWSYYYLAMAHYRLGKANEARQALDKARQIMEQKLPKPEDGDLGEGWADWLRSHMVRREAEELLKGNK